jgi:hypothetical protein
MAIEDEIKDVQQLVVNQLGVANGLNNSIADGQVTHAKMSAGCPTWYPDGAIVTSGDRIEINHGLVGNDDAYIDFHSSSAEIDTNFDARIYKYAGENSNFYVRNQGTGNTAIWQNNQIKFTTSGGIDGYTTMSGGGQGTNGGANIELYGGTHPTNANKAFIDADKLYVRKADGNSGTSYIQMSMTDDGNAELGVFSSDSSGEANVFIQSYTPSVIFSDRTTNAKDMQIQSDGGVLKFITGDVNGDAALAKQMFSVNGLGSTYSNGLRIGPDLGNGLPDAYIDGTRDVNKLDTLQVKADRFEVKSGTAYAHTMFSVQSGSIKIGTESLYPNAFTVGTGTVMGTYYSSGAQTSWSGMLQMAKAGNACIVLNRTESDGNIIQFKRDGAQSGRISVSTNITSYLSGSDYRLKEDIVEMEDGIERLKQLKPCNFAWKSDGTRVDGFIAHEAQEVVPEAVTGIKDEMVDEVIEISPEVLNAEGEVVTEAVTETNSVPEYQGIDQAKLVPLLTKALQEAVAKIEALEVRISTLEA